MVIMERPKIGVRVLIVDGNKILLGKRKNAHGQGCWVPPGGHHLEYGETWQLCAQREVLEETGLVLDEVRFCGVTNDIFADQHKHYVTIFMRAEYPGGAIQNLESEKCEAWQWFAPEALPNNLFLPLAHFVEQKQIF